MQYIRLSFNIVDNFWSTILRKVAVNDQKELKLICFNLPLNNGLRAITIICQKQLALGQIADKTENLQKQNSAVGFVKPTAERKAGLSDRI